MIYQQEVGSLHDFEVQALRQGLSLIMATQIKEHAQRVDPETARAECVLCLVMKKTKQNISTYQFDSMKGIHLLRNIYLLQFDEIVEEEREGLKGEDKEGTGFAPEQDDDPIGSDVLLYRQYLEVLLLCFFQDPEMEREAQKIQQHLRLPSLEQHAKFKCKLDLH
ncbi:hypothetical protein C8R44DRAFT_726601 [Mycena epipterygia]|nr:hypothetical protein C8R44DRAFT_726601 [Mycena epipterygia]